VHNKLCEVNLRADISARARRGSETRQVGFHRCSDSTPNRGSTPRARQTHPGGAAD
jgi:hypothetical protein